MELTIISRSQRLQASTKSLLHSLFLKFFSAFQIRKFLHKSPGRAKEKIKHVIVVGMNGNIHRRNIKNNGQGSPAVSVEAPKLIGEYE